MNETMMDELIRLTGRRLPSGYVAVDLKPGLNVRGPVKNILGHELERFNEQFPDMSSTPPKPSIQTTTEERNDK